MLGIPALATFLRFWHDLTRVATTATVASSPKLLDRVRWQLRVKHYSIRTEHASSHNLNPK
jgi:hypothetical protein